MNKSRRDFCSTSLKAAAGIGLVSAMPGVMAGCKASDKLVVGLVGCKGMGWSNLSEFLKHPDVECAALCDVDASVLNERLGNVTEVNQKKEEAGIAVAIKAPKTFSDYRKLLEEKDIDAVIVGTPDHWHTLIAIEAMQAGKHVYVEKPMANSVGECLLIEKAADRYKKVVQVGQWQRSDPHWNNAIAYVHSGQLGKIRLVKTWAYMNWFRVAKREDGPVPEGVDYDFWLGPAPKRPFNPNRFHFHFRWYWDYAGGLMTDWGVHLIDFALFGMKAGAPKSAMGSGGLFAHPEGTMETPDTQQTIYEFDNFNLVWEHAIGIEKGPYNRQHGVAFIGDNGTLVVDRGGWEVQPEIDRLTKEGMIPEVPRTAGENKGLAIHVRNFIDCVKTRNRKTNCDATAGRQVGVVSHMGNVALRTNEKIYWDNDNQRFTSSAANELLLPEYRAPWTLPKI